MVTCHFRQPWSCIGLVTLREWNTVTWLGAWHVCVHECLTVKPVCLRYWYMTAYSLLTRILHVVQCLSKHTCCIEQSPVCLAVFWRAGMVFLGVSSSATPALYMTKMIKSFVNKHPFVHVNCFLNEWPTNPTLPNSCRACALPNLVWRGLWPGLKPHWCANVGISCQIQGPRYVGKKTRRSHE